MPKIYAASPKSFTENLFLNEDLAASIWNIISDQQYVIHIKDQKYNCAPTNLLINTRFFYVLDEAKPFDHCIKTQFPTLRYLLQSINILLKFAYLPTMFRIDKTLRLCHVHILHQVSIKKRCFDIHLPYLIIKICSNC
jgi:hypothetical protein